MGVSTSSQELSKGGSTVCLLKDQIEIIPDHEDEQVEEMSGCPHLDGVHQSSFVPPSGIPLEPQRQFIGRPTYTMTTPEFTVETIHPHSDLILTLVEGMNEPGESGNPPEPPSWLDRELFDRGREFYRRYLSSVCFSNLLSLVFMMAPKRGLAPLIYTGQSDTPMKALKRYYSTLMHVVTWYTGDVWDPEDDAHKDVMSIRSIHGKVARQCNAPEENEKLRNIKVSERGHPEPESPFYPSIRDDLRPQIESRLLSYNTENPCLYLSQSDMALTQFAFMGLVVAHPEKLGAGAATEEEFAGFIHFWRGIGWLLGIDDKYNFCRGSVKETRALCLEVERKIAMAFLAEADWNYEHMATSLLTGMSYVAKSMSFPAMFRYLAYTIGVSVPSFARRMSYRQCFYFWLWVVTFKLMWFFPRLASLASYAFGSMVYHIRGKSHGKAIRNGVCPKAAAVLMKHS
ncbi:uncharacterized protein [Macrobrachium rosenbergii]|uniref:uncharacterized protein n=1 Tax=Macrobrachium rosenbergii TaxID=79674 RepID=UPI0034D77B77